MITLLTGLPGNGKTLFALYMIKAKAEKEQREVYYHGINECTLPWTKFEPKEWMDLPHGSMIVIDESQDTFPRQANGAKLPDYYSELAKHRHKGFDIFLITQHPTLLDNFVRQLVGQHFHSIRKFGLERATIYEWSAANPTPQNASSHKNAVTLKWAYPKEVYTYYKSAEVHTVKKRVPMKLILAALFVLAVPCIGYFALDSFQSRGKPLPVAGVPAKGSVGAAGSGSVPGSPVAIEKVFDPVADAKKFIAMNTPRVEGLPQTAPKFDELTKPSRVPVPAACIASASTCRCFSQQGTAMEVPAGLCKEFAKNGYFQEFDADRDRMAQNQTARSVQVLEHSPVGGTGGGFAASGVIPDLVASSAPGRTAPVRQ
jgi:zona occludens toxin